MQSVEKIWKRPLEVSCTSRFNLPHLAGFAEGFGFVHSADAGLENETEENISFDLDNLSYQAGGSGVPWRSTC